MGATAVNYGASLHTDAAAVRAGAPQGLLHGRGAEEEPEESSVGAPGGGQPLPLRPLPQQRSGRAERYNYWNMTSFTVCGVSSAKHLRHGNMTGVTRAHAERLGVKSMGPQL